MEQPTDNQKSWLLQRGVRTYDLNGMIWLRAAQCGRLLHLGDPKSAICALPRTEVSTLCDLVKHGLPKRLEWKHNDYIAKVLTWTGFCQLVSKRRGQRSTWVAKELGMQVVYKHLCQEAETIEAILKSFPGEVGDLQREVVTEMGNRYRLDLYFPEHNIVVECDELGHRSYSSVEDETRTSAIKELLQNPKFVRFNPDVGDFNLFAVIGEIYQHIRASLVKK